MNILLVKLGALGDVLRTTPLLEGLKKKYPGARITWLVDNRHRSVLERNPFIDRLESLGENGAWRNEAFDLAVNLEKEPEALDAMEAARAARKAGFVRRDGKLAPADAASEYAYRLGVDDELKFRQNKKSYQAISFEQVGLDFQNEEYQFALDGRSVLRAQEALAERGFNARQKNGKVVGINTGAGTRFAGKRLPADSYRRLAETLAGDAGWTVLLLGGEDERERNAWIARNARGKVVDTGSHSIDVFAAIVRTCDLVVTGDTTALHVAVAMKTPVLAYFASTCAAEIELYGRGRKIVSVISCAPCYKKICPIDEQCMKDMDMAVFTRNVREMLAR